MKTPLLHKIATFFILTISWSVLIIPLNMKSFKKIKTWPSSSWMYTDTSPNLTSLSPRPMKKSRTSQSFIQPRPKFFLSSPLTSTHKIPFYVFKSRTLIMFITRITKEITRLLFGQMSTSVWITKLLS